MLLFRRCCGPDGNKMKTNVKNCFLGIPSIICMKTTLNVISTKFFVVSRMRYRLARLRNWSLGPRKAVRSDSEVIQWLLDAEWFNWSPRHRMEITRDVEANTYVWITPTRLGAILYFPIVNEGIKQWATCFIQLFDHRVMKTEYFCIRTYRQWFTLLFKAIKL